MSRRASITFAHVKRHLFVFILCAIFSLVLGICLFFIVFTPFFVGYLVSDSVAINIRIFSMNNYDKFSSSKLFQLKYKQIDTGFSDRFRRLDTSEVITAILRSTNMVGDNRSGTIVSGLAIMYLIEGGTRVDGSSLVAWNSLPENIKVMVRSVFESAPGSLPDGSQYYFLKVSH